MNAGAVLKNKKAPFARVFLSRGPKLRRKRSKPRFAILLRVFSPESGPYFHAHPFRNVDPVMLRFKPLPMKWALHLGRDVALDGQPEERLFLFGKTNAIRQENALILYCFFGSLDPF